VIQAFVLINEVFVEITTNILILNMLNISQLIAKTGGRAV